MAEPFGLVPPPLKRLQGTRLKRNLSGYIYFSFGFLQRRLLHNSFLLVIIKHLCSNFRCKIPKEKQMFPDKNWILFFGLYREMMAEPFGLVQGFAFGVYGLLLGV
jgi:hypothetical protein